MPRHRARDLGRGRRPRRACDLHRSARAAAALGTMALAALATSCGDQGEDLSNGKQLFVENCATCHTLERAGSQAVRGPDLDEAFGPARRDGLGEETIQGVVRAQISDTLRGSIMPEDLVVGEDARDVAAYVAAVAGVPGEDQGQLASAGLGGAETGEQIYTAAGCAGCHTFAPAGSEADVGPSLDELADVADQRVPDQSAEDYTRAAIVEPDEFIVQGFSAGTMPGNYGEQLEEEQVQTLVEYLLDPEAAAQ